jgi:CMP-N-acetylneuraminic acid synthetase
MNNVIALLPMKGHSERVPNKNLKLFCEKPLYHSIINQLILSKTINKIIVNTDSNNIIDDIKLNFKDVTIIDRPISIQGDLVSMNKIIAHDLTLVGASHFLQTHSTNPLLKATTIDKAVNQYFSEINKYDSLFSVTKLQTRLYDKNLKPIKHNPIDLMRTQDLEPVYEENSNFYIFSTSSFRIARNERIGLKPNIFEINKIEAIDIDTKEDFIIAEAIKGKLDNETKK